MHNIFFDKPKSLQLIILNINNVIFMKVLKIVYSYA